MIPHAWIDDIATVCSRLFAEVPLRGSTRSEPPWLVVLPTKPMTVSLAFPGVLANFPFQCSYDGAWSSDVRFGSRPSAPRRTSDLRWDDNGWASRVGVNNPDSRPAAS